MKGVSTSIAQDAASSSSPIPFWVTQNKDFQGRRYSEPMVRGHGNAIRDQRILHALHSAKLRLPFVIGAMVRMNDRFFVSLAFPRKLSAEKAGLKHYHL